MSDITVPAQNDVIIIPAFGNTQALRLDMDKIREGERRLIDAKTVNPLTYAELEHTFNESYRDLRRYLSQIGFALAQAEKAMEEAKANVLLDKYPEFLKQHDMKKTQDNADLRKAFLMRDQDYLNALDRINQLKALESNFDGKVKVMEKACSYMKKTMDLILRSGLSGRELYITQGKK